MCQADTPILQSSVNARYRGGLHSWMADSATRPGELKLTLSAFPVVDFVRENQATSADPASSALA